MHAVRALTDDEVGETMMGKERVSLPKGHGLPPGAAASGHVEAMAMYAGESVAGVDTIEPAARIVQSWCTAVQASPLPD